MGYVIKKSEELWLVGARSCYRPADRQYIDEGAARVREQNELERINLVIDALGREGMREGKEGIKKSRRQRRGESERRVLYFFWRQG